MLTLKGIELVGFKSFCNSEALSFSGRGIAAVVGPNGCGKSNICDAVSWVLGEQSAKSLRGSRMNDVIFNGTQFRSPAGLASVTLTLDAPAGALDRLGAAPPNGAGKGTAPGAPGEISVSRKLFRNGASKYILNGKVVRLRDVRSLFLGTGLGPNHYAIIEQGRIGQLLSSRPKDRRAFVEEAAGVTPFKVQRHLAERKLANAALNLERVHDILSEVRRQARKLKLQASRAERFEKLQEQFQQAQERAFAYQHHQMESRRRRLAAEVGAATKEWKRAAAEADRLEAELASERDREQEAQVRLERLREVLAERRVESERVRERLAHQLQSIDANAAGVQRARQGLEAAKGRARQLEAAAEQDRRRITRLESERAEQRREVEAKSSECAAAKTRLAEAEDAREELRGTLLGTMNELFGERSRRARLEESMAADSRELERAQARRSGASDRLREAADRLIRRRERAEGLQLRKAEQAVRREELEAAVASRSQALADRRKLESDLRSRLVLLTAREESLAQTLAERVQSGSAVERLLAADRSDRQPDCKPLGVLSEFLEVDAGYERATEQLLGDDLGCLLVVGSRQAARGVELVRDHHRGSAAFLVSSSGAEQQARPLAGGGPALPLAQVARLALPGAGPSFGLPPKVADGYWVESAAEARRLAESNPCSYFVLPDGTWYHRNTVHVGLPEASGPLVLKRRIRELAPQLRRLRRDLDELQRRIDGESEALRRDRAELDEAGRRLRGLNIESATARERARRSERQLADLQRSLARAGGEIERLGDRLADRAGRRDESCAEIARLQSACQQLESSDGELTSRSAACRRELDRAAARRGRLQAELAVLEERIRSSRRSARRAEDRLSEHRARVERSEEEIARRCRESAALQASNRELERRAEALRRVLDELRSKIAELTRTLGALRGSTADLAARVRGSRSGCDALRRDCSEKKLALARALSDLDHLSRDCQSELGEDAARLAERVPPAADADAPAAARKEVAKLKKSLRRLGPVNELARKEHEEVVRRQEFLESNCQDLLDAVANTQAAIREIDGQCRDRFDEAFRSINDHFRQVFATLFEGGTGELRLAEAEEGEEPGVEIVAQPPGKRLQSVALLSGGEKSLTVMALLMAAFRHKPSPFCVLDEVDSQLDEANTVRLRRLVQEMSAETQFVMITHSKTMMEAAETLYGVTMGEAGVSRLVSVRLEGLGGRPGAAPAAAVS